MNRVILMGRLTADPEIRQTPRGTAVAKFTIAVDRRFKKDGGQQADFISCVAWRQTAEFIDKYFFKGKMIALEGQIQTRSWDGQDGKRQYATEVVADNVYFCAKEQRTDPGYQPMPDYTGGDSFVDIDDADESDLPF